MNPCLYTHSDQDRILTEELDVVIQQVCFDICIISLYQEDSLLYYNEISPNDNIA